MPCQAPVNGSLKPAYRPPASPVCIFGIPPPMPHYRPTSGQVSVFIGSQVPPHYVRGDFVRFRGGTIEIIGFLKRF